MRISQTEKCHASHFCPLSRARFSFLWFSDMPKSCTEATLHRTAQQHYTSLYTNLAKMAGAAKGPRNALVDPGSVNPRTICECWSRSPSGHGSIGIGQLRLTMLTHLYLAPGAVHGARFLHSPNRLRRPVTWVVE